LLSEGALHRLSHILYLEEYELRPNLLSEGALHRLSHILLNLWSAPSDSKLGLN
jgi:hypothetical protein